MDRYFWWAWRASSNTASTSKKPSTATRSSITAARNSSALVQQLRPVSTDSGVHLDCPPEVQLDCVPVVNLDCLPGVHLDCPPEIHLDCWEVVHRDCLPEVHLKCPPGVHLDCPSVFPNNIRRWSTYFVDADPPRIRMKWPIQTINKRELMRRSIIIITAH